MNELIIVQNGEAVTTSLIIAEGVQPFTTKTSSAWFVNIKMNWLNSEGSSLKFYPLKPLAEHKVERSPFSTNGKQRSYLRAYETMMP